MVQKGGETGVMRSTAYCALVSQALNARGEISKGKNVGETKMRGIHFGEFLQEYLLRVIALGTEIVEDPDFFDAKVNVVVLVLA